MILNISNLWVADLPACRVQVCHCLDDSTVGILYILNYHESEGDVALTVGDYCLGVLVVENYYDDDDKISVDEREKPVDS